MRKGLTVEDVKALYGKEHLFTVPTKVPEEKVLVHNQVTR
jgi:hypothetical protein